MIVYCLIPRHIPSLSMLCTEKYFSLCNVEKLGIMELRLHEYQRLLTKYLPSMDLSLHDCH